MFFFLVLLLLVVALATLAYNAHYGTGKVTIRFQTEGGKTVRKGQGGNIGEALLDGFRELYGSLSPGSYPETIRSRLETMEENLAQYKDRMHRRDIAGCEDYICRTRKLLEEKAAATSAHKSFVAEQRRLMTDSLRYDVLRRDKFRCQICGATAKDGYRLHVDHIVPVSKGGKTELGNLRTLCERCNMGKGDKIEDQELTPEKFMKYCER